MNTLKDAYKAGYRLSYLKATFTAQAVAAMFGRSFSNLPHLVRGADSATKQLPATVAIDTSDDFAKVFTKRRYASAEAVIAAQLATGA